MSSGPRPSGFVVQPGVPPSPRCLSTVLRAAGPGAFRRFVFYRGPSSRIDGEVLPPRHQDLPRSRGTC